MTPHLMEEQRTNASETGPARRCEAVDLIWTNPASGGQACCFASAVRGREEGGLATTRIAAKGPPGNPRRGRHGRSSIARSPSREGGALLDSA